MKKASLLVAFIIMLLSITPLAKATSTITPVPNAPNSPNSILTTNIDQNATLQTNNPGILATINITSIAQQLRYTNQNISSLPQTSLIKILLSQSGQDMNKSMDQIQQDLFDNSTGPSATNILTKQASANEQGSMTDQADSSGQACLIVAIWDYADPADDLPNNQYAYNALLYNVENAGYDCVVTLTNSQATHEYVWEWLTMLCASYQYVDVYFMGHGVDNYDYILPDFYGFACYDAVNADGTVNEGNEYYPEEMISYCVHPYDYSELRLGVGAFCYSAAFDCDFCFQGISYPPWPDRVWMEINGEGNADQYNIYFMAYWSYYWYVQGWDSNASFNIAASAAAPYYPPYSPFDYFTSESLPNLLR